MTKAHAYSWKVMDEFWARVEPLVPKSQRDPNKVYQRNAGAGRPPKPARLVFEAIVYVLRTGCQWKALPAERFGSASAMHQKFMDWSKAGFFEEVWKMGLAEYALRLLRTGVWHFSCQAVSSPSRVMSSQVTRTTKVHSVNHPGLKAEACGANAQQA